MESSSARNASGLCDGDSQSPQTDGAKGLLRNLSRDISLQIVGSVVASGLMLATHLSVARLLGRELFGSLGAIQLFSQWCAAFFSFGGALTITILAGQKRHTDKSALLGVMGIYFLILLALTSGAVVIERQLNLFGLGDKLDIATGVAAVAYAVLLFATESCLGLLRGSDKYIAANLFSIGHAFFIAIGAIGGALLLASDLGTLWSATLAGGLFGASTIAVISQHWGSSLRQLGEARTIAFGPGLRNYTVQVLEVASETFAIFYLVRMSDMEGVGALIACQRICTIISKPASMMSTVITGKVAGQRIGTSESLMTLRIARLTLILGLAFSIPLLVFINQFTAISLGAEFQDASLIMALHIVGAIFRGHACAAVGLVLGAGCSSHYLRLRIIILATTVLATVGLFPLVGSTAAAISYTVTSAMLAIGIRRIVVNQARAQKTLATLPTDALPVAA